MGCPPAVAFATVPCCSFKSCRDHRVLVERCRSRRLAAWQSPPRGWPRRRKEREAPRRCRRGDTRTRRGRWKQHWVICSSSAQRDLFQDAHAVELRAPAPRVYAQRVRRERREQLESQRRRVHRTSGAAAAQAGPPRDPAPRELGAGVDRRYCTDKYCTCSFAAEPPPAPSSSSSSSASAAAISRPPMYDDLSPRRL